MLLSKFWVAIQRGPYSDSGMFKAAVISALKVQNDEQKATEIAEAVAKARAEDAPTARGGLLGRFVWVIDRLTDGPLGQKVAKL